MNWIEVSLEMSGEELDAEKIEELKEVFNSHDPEGQVGHTLSLHLCRHHAST